MEDSFIKIEKLKIWAKVGVLEEERSLGQLFSFDIFLWSDFEKSSQTDDIKDTIDYSNLVADIKDYSKNFSCFTIEKYSYEIMELIKNRYNADRIKIVLTKCHPPIIGFDGNVSIERMFEKTE
tara:strand:+ start:222 stop:590 length:369 start_codon:yes stop_codon:yes gene_type:complete